MKTIFIENDVSSFADFHDTTWFADLFNGVRGPQIGGHVEEFAAQWWGASKSFVLPWLYVNGVYDLANSNGPRVMISRQELWEQLLEVNAFKASLWKIAEGSFCAIYYAYENLLVRLLSEIVQTPIRVSDRDFTKRLISVYGQSLATRFWNSNSISVAREVRNCITHNGGKATDRPLRMRPRPVVEDAEGDVLISASNVRSLYDSLKPVVREAIRESQRRLSAQMEIG